MTTRRIGTPVANMRQRIANDVRAALGPYVAHGRIKGEEKAWVKIGVVVKQYAAVGVLVAHVTVLRDVSKKDWIVGVSFVTDAHVQAAIERMLKEKSADVVDYASAKGRILERNTLRELEAE